LVIGLVSQKVRGPWYSGLNLAKKNKDKPLRSPTKTPFQLLNTNNKLSSPMSTPALSDQDIDRIIEMAWEDRTPFEAIEQQFGLREQAVIELMRRELKAASWRRWRARVQGRATKHQVKSRVDDARFKSTLQRGITGNKISKRS